MSLVLPAVAFRQRRFQMYMATVPLSALEHFSIDVWDPKNVMGRRGYQRNPDEGRIKKISKYLERRDAIMPVAGLLNVRERGRLRFKGGELVIPDGTRIWVVDMQHRLKGLVRAHEEGAIRSDSFRFPVVITEGLNQVEEAAQFYIINTRAKKMDVALTRRLLIENDRIRDIADAKPWEITAVLVTLQMNRAVRDNPWYGAIRQPNEERNQQHLATEKSFVSSLRQLLIGGRHRQPKVTARKLGAFWSAIRENVPEPFDEPRRYLIQKTHGMYAFNFFIAPIFLAKYKEKDFPRRLRGLRKLGSRFWLRANKRGARRFGTGMGGYSSLADYLKDYVS